MFYFADIGEDESGDPLKFDPTPALKAVAALKGDDGYLRQGPGRIVRGWAEPKKRRVALGNVRREDLPMVEKAGKLTGLKLLQDEGLAEQMHAVFFADNIVGADFNFYGPRMTALANYLKLKAGAPPELSFDPLVLRDLGPLINRIHDVTLLRLRIRPSYIDELKAADKNLWETFKSAQQVSDAGDIEVVVRTKPYSREGTMKKALKAIVNKLRKRKDLRENVSALIIGGRDEDGDRLDDVDVLKNLLTATKKVEKAGARTRAVNPDSAFAAIREAYDELRDQIRVARRLSGRGKTQFAKRPSES